MSDDFDAIAAQLVEAREVLNSALEQLRQLRPTSATIPVIVEAIEAAAEARAMVTHDR